jgi:hypothetical protein
VEKDRFRRAAELQETRRRLKECIRHLKSSRNVDQQFRRDLLQLYPTTNTTKEWEKLQAAENTVKSFEEMIQEQENVSRFILSHLSDHLQDLHDQILSLKNENVHLRQQIKDQSEELGPVAAPATDLDKKQVELLRKALEEQDKKFLELEIERKKSLDERFESHSISSGGVRKIHDAFKAACRDYKVDFNDDEVDVTELLVGGVQMLVGQMERMKARAKQAAEHTTDLEMDRVLCLAMLNISNEAGTRLSDAIKSKTADLEKAVKLGEDKNRNYIKEIGFLAEENEELKERCKELQEKIKVWLDGSTDAGQAKPKPKVSNGKNWKI